MRWPNLAGGGRCAASAHSCWATCPGPADALVAGCGPDGRLDAPVMGQSYFDYILWMFGEMPQTVYCVATRLNPAWEGEDEVAATLSFAGGRFACVRMSWNTRGGRGEWEGTERMLSSADILYQRQIQLDHGTLMLDDETRLVCDGETVFVDEKRNQTLRACCASLPLPSGKDVPR